MARMYNSNEIKKFEYDRIANIKILEAIRFSPIIPLMPSVSLKGGLKC